MTSEPIDVALDLAKEASIVMRKWFESGTSVDVKFDQSPVTEADIEINDLVFRRLQAEFPDHGFIGEEQSSAANSEAEYVWLCDPVDGTRPFAIGLPISTFSLALVRDGEPVVGVVAWPFRDWTFAAEKSSGASMNGDPISVDGSGPFSRVIDVVTASRYADWVPGLADELGDAGFACLALNSVAITAAMIACGRLGGAMWSADTPWDAAASKLIVEEAGGVFTDIYGADQRYDGPLRGYVAAASSSIHAELIETIARCGVKPGRRKPWSKQEHVS